MDPINIEMVSSDSSYASDVSDDGSATDSIETPKYKCKYCPKSYSKTQALGGHQNAHRREREMTKRQKGVALPHMNQPYPDLYLYPHPFPNQYAPGFELGCFNVNGSSNLDVFYNNQCPRSSNADFARLRIDHTQGIARNWAFTGIPFRPAMAQPQPSSMCLDLCLGVGSSSQIQTQPKESNGLDNKDNDLSLSLSLKL